MLTFLSGAVMYFLIWWLVIFAVLPWGNRAADKVETGHAPSAPARPNLRQKIIATSVVAFLIWLAANPMFGALLDHAHDQAKHMRMEDDGLKE